VIRSFIFNAVFYPFLIIFSVLLIILYPFLKTISLQKLISIWVYLILKLLKAICMIDWEIEGKENLIDRPCIIASNHQGPWESLFLQTLIVPSTSVVKKSCYLFLFLGGLWLALNQLQWIEQKSLKALSVLLIRQN
jgi:1-acyl-sn-glycerol-3-phosphate acyltransferase